jgi:hypothetical protein
MESAERLRRQGTNLGRLVRRSLARGRYESTVAYRLRDSKARALPTFLIIGAQKGGTTSLHEYLAEHPEVGSSSIKEVQYFSLNSHRSIEWYRAHFPERDKYRHVFESSPYYLFHPCCPQRIHLALPDVKLIVLLRDPVDRAYSHHNHECALGFESLDFAAALAREQIRLAGEEGRIKAERRYRSFAHQHYSYLARGMYAEQLERWLQFFPREQMLLLASEDLFADPARTLHHVQDWLGLSSHTPAGLSARNARTYSPMTSQLHEEFRSRFRTSSADLLRLTGLRFPWA